ncbi:hypothetical protein [Tellurirhabdus bombi]|uniref:hypothetical protein n=1 Tax=Tellurirhabdus bombi TaxID=2907205 RepID=UPI001F30BF90|nr:hypothetical protein [Tellurirhabdus bombi]
MKRNQTVHKSFSRFAAVHLFAIFCLTQTAYSQTVYSSTEKVEQQSLKGITIDIPAEGKFVEREWETLLKSYGRVVTSRGGVYKVPAADIKPLSVNPVNLTSRISASKDKAKLFVAADLGSGNYVTVGSREYDQLETLVKDFAGRTLLNNELRAAEQSFNDAQKQHEKSTRAGEKLVRDIERNKKEKENLLRRLDENAKELEQLEKNVESNKTEQTNTQTELDNKKSAVEAVRTKIPR